MQTQVQKIGVCFALLFFSVSSTIFAELSKSTDGSYPYDTFVIPTVVECVKFAVSLQFLLKMKIYGEFVKMNLDMSSVSKYSVPGLFYFISNNCIFYIIQDLGPTQFQILKNLNIISTALFMRLLLSRHLTWLQWKALILLAIGSTVTQLANFPETFGGSVKVFVIVFVYVFSSGAGGVFGEKLLKGQENGGNDNIHWQNIQLYMFGIIYGLISLFFRAHALDDAYKGPFSGFNIYAYLVIISLSTCGLLISFILKYLDNIAKCFVSALSMIVVAIYQSIHRAEFVSIHCIMGILLTCIALEQYNILQ